MSKSLWYVTNLPDLRLAESQIETRDQRKKILDGVADGMQHDDSKRHSAKILLKLQVLIGGDESVEAPVECRTQQPAVRQACPALALDSGHLVADDLSCESTRKLFIKQNAHV